MLGLCSLTYSLAARRKRKVKGGKLDVDFEDRALIINYEVEATVLGDFGAEMQTEKKSHAKRIRLKKLDQNTNVPALAEEIDAIFCDGLPGACEHTLSADDEIIRTETVAKAAPATKVPSGEVRR